MTQSSRQHFTSVDALRGFAALSVSLFHLGGAGLPKLASPLTTRLTSWGYTGVEVFFVISGFVIPFVMLKGAYHWRDAGQFLARRFIRIWPPSAILIALTVAQYAVVMHIGHGGHTGWTRLTVPGILANLLYAVPFTGQEWLNGILWTLSVEFQFYLFLAFAFPLLASNRAWLMLAGIASLLSSLLPLAGIFLFLKFSVYFAMGGAALLYREQRIGRLVFVAVIAVMGGAATVELGWLPTVFALATTLAIAFLPIRSRLFVFLGTISYSLYLVHMLVASTVEFLLVRAFDPVTAVERVVGQLICIGAAIGGAWIFYLLVERHFVVWSQRFAGYLRGEQFAHPKKIIPSEGM